MNAGQEGSIVVSKVKEQKNADEGFNAATETYEDLVKAGVIDPGEGRSQRAAERLVHRLTAADHRSARLRDPRGEEGAGGGGHSHGGPGMGGMYLRSKVKVNG